MRKRLKIDNIYIDFTYQFNDFFGDSIKVYETEETEQSFSKMSVFVQDNIEIPKREITFTYKNRFKMETETDCYIVTMSGETVKHIIYYTYDFKKIEIILNKNIGMKLPEIEYTISGLFFLEIAMSENYLPIHASCLSYRNQTFLLSGPSQSGKSTQSNYFIEKYPETIVINEDKPILFFKDNQWFVSGSPWSGKNVINKNIIKAVNYLFFINQAETNTVKELDDKTKIKHVFKNIHRATHDGLVDKMIALVEPLMKELPIYQFDCINNKSSSEYLLNFMEDKNEN